MSSQPPQMPPSGVPSQGYAPQGYAPPGYVPQYGFQHYYQETPDHLLAPARRASWVLITVGTISLLVGACLGAMFGLIDEKLFADAIEQARRQQGGPMPITAAELRHGGLIFGVASGIFGLITIALGILVRGGTRVWAIVGIVFVAMPLLFLLFVTLSSLFAGVGPFAANLICFSLPCLAFGLAILFLSQAIANAARIEAARQRPAYDPQQYAAWYAQSQQPTDPTQHQQQQPPETPS
jgi:hypothetical protein